MCTGQTNEVTVDPLLAQHRPLRSSSNPTAPGKRKENASTAPWPPNGPTDRPSPATPTATAALAPWLEHYNTVRRHSAFGGSPRLAACNQRAGWVHVDTAIMTYLPVVQQALLRAKAAPLR